MLGFTELQIEECIFHLFILCRCKLWLCISRKQWGEMCHISAHLPCLKHGLTYFIALILAGVKTVTGIVRVKASRITRTTKWYSLGGCRTAQALLNSQLKDTELIRIQRFRFLWKCMCGATVSP